MSIYLFQEDENSNLMLEHMYGALIIEENIINEPLHNAIYRRDSAADESIILGGRYGLNIEAIKGDTEYYDVSVVREGAAVNLEGANVKAWFTVKRESDELDTDALISLNSTDDPTQIVFSNRPGGLLYIKLLPADTVNIEEDYLLYDVQVREQDGRITTVRKGELKLVRDITRLTA